MVGTDFVPPGIGDADAVIVINSASRITLTLLVSP